MNAPIMSVAPFVRRVCAKVGGIVSNVSRSPFHGNCPRPNNPRRNSFSRFRSTLSVAMEPACTTASRCRDDPCMVETRWEGLKDAARYPGVWLRDNCQCPTCFHPSSLSRAVHMQDLDPDIQPADVKVDPDNQLVVVTWPDGHVSPFKFSWLWHRRPLVEEIEDMRGNFLERPLKLWGSELNNKVPTDSLQNILNDDHALYRWTCLMEEIGLFLITDSGDATGLHKLTDRVAFLRKTNYGETFAVKTKTDPSNLAYTSASLGLHTDLPYYVYTPGIQILQCMKQTKTEGGDSEFADGFYVAEKLRQCKPDIFELLTKLPIEFSDIGTDYIKFHMLDRKPTISLSNDGKISFINYNNVVRDTYPTVSLNKIRPLYAALRTFDDMLYHPENLVRFKLRDGDMVCFHNYRVLHGREGYRMTSGGERELLGGYVDWDEVRSRRRVLQEKLRLDGVVV